MESQEYKDSMDSMRNGGVDDCDCGCFFPIRDEGPRKVVIQMISQLDEVMALSSGPVYREYMKNESLQLRTIELLNKVEKGALSLPDEYKNRKTKVDWDFLQTLNIQVVHPEFGMNPETLWDIIRLEIPFLNKMLGLVINGCNHE
jgi:uncharacterized protein with HEPN domain